MEYKDKSVADLKRFCQKAGLPTVGKKSTLMRRLGDANHVYQTSLDRTLMKFFFANERLKWRRPRMVNRRTSSGIFTTATLHGANDNTDGKRSFGKTEV